ncbi:MAG: FtsX-like permease family protein [Acidimicrobiales bacterium]
MSGRSLLFRWNVRVLRREWRQHLVIFLLILFGVALAVGGTVAAFNLVEPPTTEYGRAQFSATSASPEALSEALDAGGHSHARRESATLRLEGSAQRLDARVLDPASEITEPLLELREGSWPNDGDQVAVTDRALIDGQTVGETVQVSGRTLSIVGVVENPTRLSDEFLLLTTLDGYGLTAQERTLEFLVDADPSIAPFAGVDSLNISSAGGPSPRTAVAMLAGAVSTLGMLEVTLLIGAAFAVIARRRSQQYGLLAAAGATPADLRTAATISGAILGILGATVGFIVAIGVVAVLLPTFETSVGHRVDLDIPWLTVGPTLALAVVVASMAARWPARPLAKLPIASLLRATRPQPPSAGRPAFLGLVLATLGGVALGFGFTNLNTPLALLGVVVAPVGLLLMTPLLVSAIGRAPRRFPVVLRMAGRAVGRHNRRSAAVVAALALAISVPVGIAVVSGSLDQRASARGPNLADNSFIAWQPGADDGAIRIPVDLDATRLDRARARIVEVAPELELLPIEAAVAPGALVERWDFDAIGSQRGVEPVLAGRRGNTNCLACDSYGFGEIDEAGNELVYTVEDAWISSPGLIAALGLDVIPGHGGGVARSGDDVIILNGVHPQSADLLVAADWPRNTRIPSVLIPPRLVAAEGLDRVQLGWYASSGEAISAEVRSAVRGAVGPELLLEFPAEPEPRSSLRLIGLIGGLVLGLGIAISSIGLFSSELAGDLRTLSAIGAAPATQRKLAASIAGILASAGAVVALVIGYLPLIPMLSANEFEFEFVVPWLTVAGFAVVFPMLAGGAGWLLGRPPADAAPSAMV